jgi:uncharacterized protein with PIN domain
MTQNIGRKCPLQCDDEPLRLLADGMLGKLAKWLRLLGYDTAYDNTATDPELARRARAEGRVLLTRDHELSARRGLRTLLIQSEVLEEQVYEVRDTLGPPPHPPLSRCAVCNAVLKPASLAEVADRVPPYVLKTQAEFRCCSGCGRVYWPGSHFEAIRGQVEKLTSGEAWTLACPRCDGEVGPDDTFCPHCGFVFESKPETKETERGTELEPGSEPGQPGDLTCPQCSTRVYLGDPACATCGQPLCPRCGTAVDEAAECCSHCSMELTFTCPGCGMELLSGAEVCPDCRTVFTRRCPKCGEPLFRAPDRCPNCQQPVTHQVRETARSISRRVGNLLVRWAVCPVCGAHFLPSKGPCPECGTRLCPQCSLILLPEESTCPRCGSEIIAACPRCGTAITASAPECPACGQPLCPNCGAAVGENDTICPTCSAELALLCSECGGEVEPSDTHCPHCGEPFDASA